MTMTASAPTIQTPTVDPTASVATSAASRAAALKLTIDAESAEPAGESSATSAPAGEASSSSDSAAAAPAAATPEAQRIADRQARIEKVRAREAASEAKQREQQQGRARDTEVETLKQAAAELDQLKSMLKSPAALLAAAEKEGTSVEELVKEIKTRLHDPSAVAKREATTEAEKLRAEMKAMDARHAAEIEKIRAEKAQTEMERTQEAKTSTFLGDAKTKTDSHPRTARAIAAWKGEGLIGFVNQVIAPHLPRSYDTQYLHDVLEDYFEKTHAFGGQPTPEAAPAATGSTRSSTKNGAAQPATTLSNALTSGRESLVEETPLHKLSREERIRRAREE